MTKNPIIKWLNEIGITGCHEDLSSRCRYFIKIPKRNWFLSEMPKGLYINILENNIYFFLYKNNPKDEIIKVAQWKLDGETR